MLKLIALILFGVVVGGVMSAENELADKTTRASRTHYFHHYHHKY